MKNIENNRLIAEFMAFQTRTDAVDDRVLAYYVGNVIKNADNSKNENEENVFHPEDMRFDTDWNWLMEVMDKILNVSLKLDTMELYYDITDNIPNIEETYKSILEFINWYNTENKK